MKYKDAVSYDCKCGRELAVPFPSMQTSPNIAPSNNDLKIAQERLTQEIIYHQNNNCSYMHNERVMAKYATKPKDILLQTSL